MAMEYFPCFYSYAKKTANLSDSEVGRLFRSLMQYGETGVRPELNGREAVAFDFIADDIDRSKSAYAEKCEKASQNASKRYPVSADACDRMPPHANACGSCQTKTKTESKTKTKTKTDPPSEEIKGPLALALDDFREFRKEIRKPLTKRAEKMLLRKLEKLAPGNDDMKVEILEQSMVQGWAGVWPIKEDMPGRAAPQPDRFANLRRLHDMFAGEEADPKHDDGQIFTDFEIIGGVK